MDMSRFTPDERLTRYQLQIEVASTDTEIGPIIANYGYDGPAVLVGKGHFDTAFGLNQKQKQEYGEKYTATDVFTTARQQAFGKYMEYAELARIVFKRDRGMLAQLDLVGARESNYDKLYMQMMRFYDTALGSQEILDRLARFNLTSEKLQAAKELVLDMKTRQQEQMKESSEAQRATLDRDEAMETLDDWMSDFIAVAKIALAGHPQYLERLRIVDPS